MEHLNTYGGPIQAFYTQIGIAQHKNQAARPDDRASFPWSAILEERTEHPFPVVRINPQANDYGSAKRANELIVRLNTTEDIMVFKIAMNALLRLAQGENAPPIYPGPQYHPDFLEDAIKAAEEE